MKNNTIVVHDSDFVMTKAYREGALAMRKGVSWSCNPHSPESQAHQDWEAGHVNEAAREHIRFGKDVLEPTAFTRCGQRITMDASIPRDERGDVERAWYAQASKSVLSAAQPQYA